MIAITISTPGKANSMSTENDSSVALGAMTPIAVALVVWRTPEKIAPEVAGQQFRMRDYWALIARPSFARILLADLCLALGPGWMSALYLFFFTDSRGYTTGQASILLAIYILAGFVGAPLMGRLATKISKHRAVMVATTGYSLVLISLMAIPQGNMLIGAVPMFMAGFLAAGFNVLTRAMTADIADEVRLEQGRERAGLLYAMTVMTSKIAGAFSIGLTFFVLSKVGYIATEGAANTPEAIHDLELAYLIGPVAFVMLGGRGRGGAGKVGRGHGAIIGRRCANTGRFRTCALGATGGRFAGAGGRAGGFHGLALAPRTYNPAVFCWAPWPPSFQGRLDRSGPGFPELFP